MTLGRNLPLLLIWMIAPTLKSKVIGLGVNKILNRTGWVGVRILSGNTQPLHQAAKPP